MLMQKRNTSLIPLRLGALLISANLLRADAMANALMIARQSGRKLGELLVLQNLISADDLNNALELQQLIKDGSITVEMGTRALKCACNQGQLLKQALADLGWSDCKIIKNHDLASLLLAAGIIKQEQIEQASWNCAKNRLPLGRNLILLGHITPSLLGAALNGLVLLRDGKVSFDVVSQALKICAQKRIPLEEALNLPLTISLNHVRIGELLSNAGLLSESDAMIAVENGLLNQQPIGDVLLRTHMISPLVLDATLKLQALIEDGRISRLQASELLRLVAMKQVKLDDFLSEMSYLKSRVLELLVGSGLITDEQIASALQCTPQESDIIRVLFKHGTLLPELFRAAVRCVYGIDAGSLTNDDATRCLRTSFAPPPAPMILAPSCTVNANHCEEKVLQLA